MIIERIDKKRKPARCFIGYFTLQSGIWTYPPLALPSRVKKARPLKITRGFPAVSTGWRPPARVKNSPLPPADGVKKLAAGVAPGALPILRQ
jgi:hypothetical protein